MAPKSAQAERSCIVTRQRRPPEGLIRFVAGPDGRVVPDIKGRLPGRGVWVSGRRDMVETAVRKRLFAHALKAEATVPEGLADLIDRLLGEAALGALAMARKAGLVVTGFGQVAEAIARADVVAVVHAREAAADGRRKIAQAIRRRCKGGEAVPAAGAEGAQGRPDAAITQHQPACGPKVLTGIFASSELDLALGGANVIHAALLAGGASASFLKCAAALALYRGEMPETDWTANLD